MNAWKTNINLLQFLRSVCRVSQWQQNNNNNIHLNVYLSEFIFHPVYPLCNLHAMHNSTHSRSRKFFFFSLSLPRSRSVYIEEGHKFIFIRMKFAEILYFRYSDIETQSIWNELLLSCGAILFLFFYIKNKYSLFFLFFSIISSISYFVADNCVKVYGHWQHK